MRKTTMKRKRIHWHYSIGLNIREMKNNNREINRQGLRS